VNGILNYLFFVENPSPKLQRQLVLIAKVLQNVANMSKSTKESFMNELTTFRDKNIPKIQVFYDQILVSLPPYDTLRILFYYFN